jgi:CRP/FNR family transcriptional regulator, cyclic AMP receptor protein
MTRKADKTFRPKAFLSSFDGGRTVKEYSKNKIVFAQDDRCDAVYYLEKGKVKLTVTSEQGKEAVVALLDEGDFFGEGCLAGQPVRMATVTTMTEAIIVRIEKAAMVRALRERPQFSEWKRISSTSCSIPAKNGWPGCCCYWPMWARKRSRSRYWQKLAKRLLLK